MKRYEGGDCDTDLLSALHPDYSPEQLEEAHRKLVRHFELAWEMFLHIDPELSTPTINLTRVTVNPTVKPPKPANKIN